MKFKLGDKVKLVSVRFGDWIGNPIWGGQFGKIQGTIISLPIIGKIGAAFWIKVKWSNGKQNSYYESDLDFVFTNPDEVIYG